MRLLIVISLGCFVAGGIVQAIASRDVNCAERRARWIKFSVYFAVVMTMLGTVQLGRFWLQLLMGAIIAAGAFEVIRALRLARIAGQDFTLRVSTVYVLIATASWLSLSGLATGTVAFVYIVVAGFDGFSQVTGQLLGRRRLMPTISPGKTLEGLAGGLCGALGTALLARGLIGQTPLVVLQSGVMICLAGLAGDLSASWLKRRARIKDFSRALPQHGGILDRFDSFLPALALCGPWFHFQLGR